MTPLSFGSVSRGVDVGWKSDDPSWTGVTGEKGGGSLEIGRLLAEESEHMEELEIHHQG